MHLQQNESTGDTIVEEETESQTEWSEELFIEELKQYRCLWDTSCRSYKDGPKKQQSWWELSQKFEKEGNFCLIFSFNFHDVFRPTLHNVISYFLVHFIIFYSLLALFLCHRLYFVFNVYFLLINVDF